jgi:ubiquitin-conjugating enzyme E2 R
LDGDALFKWTVGLVVVNPDSAFSGAYFKVRIWSPVHLALLTIALQTEMKFTENYPYAPPTFKFIRPIYHPNIYSDGKVCISILHTPGEDEQSGELASERWSPAQSVESVLRSILLLLDDPYISSPANVDAGVLYRDDREAYNKKAKEAVEASQQDIPEDFVMPKTLTEAPPAKIVDDDDFWNESGDEDDFGASDSSEEDFGMDEDEEEGEEEMEEEEEEEQDEDMEE